MFYSIDRFEGDFAVLISDVDGSVVNVPRESLSADAEEGCLCRFENGFYVCDHEATAIRRQEMILRMKRLMGR